MNKDKTILMLVHGKTSARKTPLPCTGILVYMKTSCENTSVFFKDGFLRLV